MIKGEKNKSSENAIISIKMKQHNISKKRFKEVKSQVEDLKNFTFSFKGLKKTDGDFDSFVKALQNKYGHNRFRIYLSYEKNRDDMELWITFLDKEAFDIGMRSFLSPEGVDVPMEIILPSQQQKMRLTLGRLGMIERIQGKNAISAIVSAIYMINKET